MLEASDTTLVIVDVQERLMPVMHAQSELRGKLAQLVKGAQALELPIIITQQNSDALGPTIPEITDLVDIDPVEKLTFSCCEVEEFDTLLSEGDQKRIILAGVETHVCVFQTLSDLRAQGYEVHVPVDCVSSRNPEHKELALQRMRDEGAVLTCVEMLLFEMQKIASGDRFKKILKLIK